MSPETTAIVIIILLAVLLDAGLVYWMRRRRGQRLSWTLFRRLSGVHAGEIRDHSLEENNPAGSAARAFTPVERISLLSGGIVLNLHWLEWGIIILAVSLFCAGFLDLSSATRLPGNESEVFQSLDWTLVNSLRHYGQFPLWNPYIRTGAPYVADPMLHVYNPVATLPVLLFGVRVGFKLAVYLSILIAALGMWRLASELDLKAPLRVWVALMAAFAGQPLAHFFQGQYLFILGYAWIPWIMVGLFLVARTRRLRYVALTVLSLGLLFFSGNAYYSFYVLLMAGLFGLVMLPQIQARRPYVKVDLKLLALFGTMAILALGLVAVQLLPETQFWPWIRKDMHVAGSHTLKQIFLDYTSKDSSRPDAFSQLPAREEFYAYIGLGPFLGLLLLPLAWQRRKKRPIVFLLLVLLLVVMWVTIDQMPWRELFLGLPGLRQFRHLLRILVLGSLALILLAGMGLNELWQIAARPYHFEPAGWRDRLSNLVSLASSTLVIVFLVVSLVDLFQTNAPITKSTESHQPAYTVMNWLRGFDPSEYYVKHNPNNSWQDATIAADLRYFDVWYHYADIRNANQQINLRLVEAAPKYIVQSSHEPAPSGPGIRLVNQMVETNIYQDLHSLPVVFKVATSLIQTEGAGPLTPEEVVSLPPEVFSPNRIQVAAEGAQGETLVVLVSHYPDWSVAIDGQPVELLKVGGFLATEMRAGRHLYTFTFRPKTFWAGLLISLLAAGGTLLLLFSDLDFSRQNVLQAESRLAMEFGRVRHELGQARLRVAGWLNSGIFASHPQQSAQIETVHEIETSAGLELRVAAQRWVTATGDLLDSLSRVISTKMIIWIAVLGVYLITRLVGLTQFPIYFFTDEAVQTVLAGDLVRDHFKNYAGDFLPAYFQNGGYYRLGVSVYAQVVPYLMFGKSIAVTRGTSVLITLLGAIAVGLILRNHFRLRFWWSGILLLSLAPAWFLHSRTAFEYAEAVTFFTLFIYFYLQYRSGRLHYLYLALLAAGLAFYTYSPFQAIMGVCGLLLLLVDWRYHWKNRSIAGRGLLLAILLAIPYLRFVLTHSQANLNSLAALGSIWVRPVPPAEKWLYFAREYLHGLSPAYWFWPQDGRLIRHEMKGYAYLPWAYLPLILIGIGISLRNFRQGKRGTADERRLAAFRTVLICLLAVPSGAALVQVGITRLLAMVIPAILFAAVGLDWILSLISRRMIPARVLALGVFIGLAGLNFWMLRDALVNGPTWYSDYGMSGLQYGTKQVFPAAQQYVQENPDSKVLISPTWANGTDVLARFMLPENLAVELGSISGYMDQHKTLDENTLFVLPPDEYQAAVESGKFTGIQVVRTLPYPDGRPGFYFVKLRYVDEIDQILAAESEQRHLLQDGEINLDGQEVKVRFSPLDMGSIEGLFDHNDSTVTRTWEANPYVLELAFSKPRTIRGLSIIIGSSEVEITALRYPTKDSKPDQQIARFKGSVEQPEVYWEFDQALNTSLLRLEVRDIHQTEPAHVHIWELKLH